ncbi:MAG: copper resistance CopC family protein [Acidiferrobacterales bacterium]
MAKVSIAPLAIGLLVLLLVTQPAEAHAFPDHSLPRVGSDLNSAPTSVQIWFDGDIEPVFSTLVVKTVAGAQVSAGQGRVSPSNSALLETKLPKTLAPGKYYVYWSVIARDGHHTEGRYPFRVK